MANAERGSDPAYSRQWRGDHQTWMRAYTKEYANMPVTTYRIGPSGERQLIEATNS